MTISQTTKRNLIEDQPALIVIDIQAGSFSVGPGEGRSIPVMPNYAEHMQLARTAIDKARECDIPVIFIQEVHRPDLVDFGTNSMAVRLSIVLKMIRIRKSRLMKWDF